VPKADWAKRDFFDVWFPLLAPSEALLREAQAVDDAAGWKRFSRKFKAEMKRTDAARSLDLLAALSHRTDFSMGCYCQDATRCHRSLLRELLAERRADLEKSVLNVR
jgi:uncharacterized protein YeaO (DUF488 family)